MSKATLPDFVLLEVRSVMDFVDSILDDDCQLEEGETMPTTKYEWVVFYHKRMLANAQVLLEITRRMP